MFLDRTRQCSPDTIEGLHAEDPKAEAIVRCLRSVVSPLCDQMGLRTIVGGHAAQDSVFQEMQSDAESSGLCSLDLSPEIAYGHMKARFAHTWQLCRHRFSGQEQNQSRDGSRSFEAETKVGGGLQPLFCDRPVLIHQAINDYAGLMVQGKFDVGLRLLDRMIASHAQFDREDSLAKYPLYDFALRHSNRRADFGTAHAIGALYRARSFHYLLDYFLGGDRSPNTVDRAYRDMRYAAYYFHSAKPPMVQGDAHIHALLGLAELARGDIGRALMLLSRASILYSTCSDVRHAKPIAKVINSLLRGDRSKKALSIMIPYISSYGAEVY